MATKTWTTREIFDRMCACTTDEEAQTFFDEYVDWMRKNATGSAASCDPVDVCRQNVGYLGGYGAPNEIIERFRRVTGSYHPVFDV